MQLPITPWKLTVKWRYSSIILDLGNKWRWVVSLCPCRFNPGERRTGNHWIRSWVNLSAGADSVEYRNICSSHRESNPGRPARSYRYSDWDIPASKPCTRNRIWFDFIGSQTGNPVSDILSKGNRVRGVRTRGRVCEPDLAFFGRTNSKYIISFVNI
jgi:hypothetical protein